MTEEVLALRCGVNMVRLDREREQVLRHGHSIAQWNQIEGVRLERNYASERKDGWLLSLQLKGGKAVILGEVTDEVDASTAAARVARFCNVRVEARR